MLFNSISFLIFLPIVYGLYWWIQSWENFKHTISVQNILLLIASYFFYACWDWRFLFLLFFSTFLDYFSGKKIFSTKLGHPGLLFIFILPITLSLLIFFKFTTYPHLRHAIAFRYVWHMPKRILVHEEAPKY